MQMNRYAYWTFCAVVGFGTSFGLTHCANAGELRVRIWQEVPTVPGIRPDASGQAYRPAGPVAGPAPSARVWEMPAPAPAGRCGSIFEVVSGPKAARGCYGQN